MADYIVVDSDILIDASLNIQQAKECLKHLESKYELAISIVSRMEVLVGSRNKQEWRNIEKFIKRFQLLYLNEAISVKADELLMEYRLSHGLLIPDALIAATAIICNYPLISKNQRDYRFISELDLEAYP